MMAHMPAVNIFIPGNEIPRRKEEVDRFREIPDYFDKFIKLLLIIIGLKATDIRKKFTDEHSTLLVISVLLILFFFLQRLMGIMLGPRSQCLRKILLGTMLVFGSLVIVLLLAIFNLVIGWLALGFLVAIFSVTAYYYCDELYQFVVRPVSDTINRFIGSCRAQGADLPV